MKEAFLALLFLLSHKLFDRRKNAEPQDGDRRRRLGLKEAQKRTDESIDRLHDAIDRIK